MAVHLSEITSIIHEVLRDNDVDIAPATRFDDLPDWDSMDLISVVVEAECRFGLAFDASEIDQLTTVGGLLEMIAVKQVLTAA